MPETEFLIRIQRDLGIALSATPDLDEGLRLCLSAAIRAAAADGGGIYLRDVATGDLRFTTHEGLSSAFVAAVFFFPSDSPNARMVAEGKPLYIKHSEIPLTLVEADEQLQALAVVPVRSQGQVIACLNVASKTEEEFREPQRIALETIATQIGGAIRRLQLETDLQVSESRYRLVLQNAHDAILIHEFSPSGDLGPVVECNSAACRLLGVSVEELLRRPLMSFVAPADRDRVKDEARRLVIEGSASIEISIVRDAGDQRLVDVHTGLSRIGQSLVGISVLRDMTERRVVDKALRRSQEELRALTTRLARTAEHERQFIASELHDGVTQSLMGLRFSLASMTRAMPEPADSPIRGQLLDASESLGDVLVQIRHLISGLRPPLLEHFGPVAAVRCLTEMFEKKTGIAVDVSGDETSVEASSDASLVLFRVAQEALNNVAKHAEAQHVTVAISATAVAVTMHITDDGCGFEPDRVDETANGEYLGVITMQERARSVGGSLQIGSAPSKGTRVTLTVPGTVLGD